MNPVITERQPDLIEKARFMVMSPCGYHLGYVGEHFAYMDTLEEAKALTATRCDCDGCVDWRRDGEVRS